MPDGQRSTAGRRPILVTAGLLLLLAVVIFREGLTGGQVLLPGESLFGFPPWSSYPSSGPWIEFDLIFQFYPWQHFGHECLRDGLLPLWNPHIFCGAPFTGAGQPAPFHPINALSHLLTPAGAFNFLLPIRTLLAAVGATLLLLRLGCTTAAAVAAGVVFGFSGGMIHFAGKANPSVIAMLPWLMLAVERLGHRPGPAAACWFGLALGVMFLGGHVESAFYVFVFTLSHGVWLICRQTPAARSRRIVWFAAGLVPGCLLPGLQGLPFIEYLIHSNAYAERLHGFASLPGIPLTQAIHLAFPDIAGDPFNATFPGGRFAYNELTSATVGLVPLLLALAAVRAPGLRGLRRFLVCWCGVSIAGMYEVPAVSSVLRALPGFNLSNNLRMALILHFALALLAGLGVERFARGTARAAEGKRTLILACAALVAGICGAALAAPTIRHLAGVNNAGFVSIVNGIAAIAAAFVLFARRRTSSRPAVTAAALTLLIAATVYPFARRANAAVPIDRLFPTTAGIDAATATLHNTPGRIAGIGRALFPNAAMIMRWRDIRGYDALTPHLMMELLQEMDPGLRDRPVHDTCHFAVIGQVKPALLDLLGVTVLIFPPEAALAAGDLIRNHGWKLSYQGDSYVLRNPARPSRAVFASAVPLQPPQTALAAFSAPDYRPDQALAAGISRSLPAGQSRVLSIGDPSPHEVVIEVEAVDESFLRLADTSFPGWLAEIDGSPVEWVTTDHALRGISVPIGRHTITWRYRPRSFAIGLFLTLSALGSLAGLAAANARR